MDVKGIKEAIDDAVNILQTRPTSSVTPHRVIKALKRAQNILWNGIGEEFLRKQGDPGRLVDAVDRLRQVFEPMAAEAKRQGEEWQAREKARVEELRFHRLSTTDYKAQCPFCQSTDVMLCMRATTVFGCSVCLLPFIRKTFPAHWKD